MTKFRRVDLQRFGQGNCKSKGREKVGQRRNVLSSVNF